ncbi:MAG: periplasmic heavy metal sensor [bacterium]
MNKVISLGLALILAVSMSSLGNTESIKEHPEEARYHHQKSRESNVDHPQDMVRLLKTHLDLNQEQQSKIRQLTVANKKEIIPLKSSVEVTKIEIHELLMATETDEKKLQDNLDKLADLRSKIEKSRIHLILEIKKLLTKAQLEKLSTMPLFESHGPMSR